MLKQDNIVQLREAFKRKEKLYLVFEYVEQNLLEVLERQPNGLDVRYKLVGNCTHDAIIQPNWIRRCIYQLCKAIEYCHKVEIIHRDVKPENLLISHDGTLKLCDFGFARVIPQRGSNMTDYVATRWYRAPELLICAEYGKAADIWAIGCIMGELIDGQPLFPGEGELDQLRVIQKVLGPLTAEQRELMQKHPRFLGTKFPEFGKPETIEKHYLGNLSKKGLSFMKGLLKMDPNERFTASEALQHPYFEGLNDSPQNMAANNQIREEKTPKNNSQKPLITPKNGSNVARAGFSNPTTGISGNGNLARGRIGLAEKTADEDLKPRKSVKLQDENKSFEANVQRESVRLRENIPSNRSNSLNKNPAKPAQVGLSKKKSDYEYESNPAHVPEAFIKTRYGGAAVRAYNYDIAENIEDETHLSKDMSARDRSKPNKKDIPIKRRVIADTNMQEVSHIEGDEEEEVRKSAQNVRRSQVGANSHKKNAIGNAGVKRNNYDLQEIYTNSVKNPKSSKYTKSKQTFNAPNSNHLPEDQDMEYSRAENEQDGLYMSSGQLPYLNTKYVESNTKGIDSYSSYRPHPYAYPNMSKLSNQYSNPEIIEHDQRNLNIIYNNNVYNYNITSSPTNWNSKKKH